MGVAKNSPYFPFMNYVIWKMRENGDIQLLRHKYEKKPPNCDPIYTTVSPLSFTKLATVFMIVSMGGILSLLICFLETVLFSPPEKPADLKNESINNNGLGEAINDVKSASSQLDSAGYTDKLVIEALIYKLKTLESKL